jgi:D-sedoheptulose 7-phosphate isomerase
MVDVKSSNSKFIKNLKISIENLSSEEKILNEITEIFIKKRENGNKIIVFGNGGSASTSSHFVSDLLKTSIVKDSKRFRAISLVDNIPVMTAWSNDVSYDDIFIEQLKNFIESGDLIVAFSGSGKSENVVRAMKYAKESNATVIGFTGMSGGVFPDICDICHIVPNNDMLIIESIHVMLCHCIISTMRNLGDPQFKYE